MDAMFYDVNYHILFTHRCIAGKRVISLHFAFSVKKRLYFICILIEMCTAVLNAITRDGKAIHIYRLCVCMYVMLARPIKCRECMRLCE